MELKTKVLSDDLRFPECPRWHDSKLWFSDMFENRVMAIDLEGNLETIVEVPTMPIGLAWTPEGRLLIVSAQNRRLLRLEGESLVEVADMSVQVEYACNDLVVDGQGNAYVGNMGYEFGDDPKTGYILLVTPDGNVRIVADGLAFPNGMVITPDGRTLIVAESHVARLTAFDIESERSLGNRRAWAQFEDHGEYGATEGQIVPDGICLDAEGAVWLASPNTKDVLRVREGGEIVQRIPLDTIPLACMLGGPERRTLFITTTDSLNPYEDGARGHIETVEVDVAGAGFP